MKKLIIITWIIRRLENLTKEKRDVENNLNRRIENLTREKNNIQNNLNRRIEILKQEKRDIEDDLNSRIEDLKQEKNNIEFNLNRRIEELKKENDIIKKNFTLDMNELKDKIRILSNDINNKYQEINDYKSHIKKMKEEEKKDIPLIKSGETIFSVLFMSQGCDDIKNYAMTVKNTDIFSSLEERLFKDFPQYKNLKLIFMVNAKYISSSKTLEENKIKHNDIINVFINEFE